MAAGQIKILIDLRGILRSTGGKAAGSLIVVEETWKLRLYARKDRAALEVEGRRVVEA